MKKKLSKRTTSRTQKRFRSDLRTAIADYMRSEGCSCCRDEDDHRVNAERIAKLLNVKKYSDGSGYDFDKYKTKKIGLCK